MADRIDAPRAVKRSDRARRSPNNSTAQNLNVSANDVDAGSRQNARVTPTIGTINRALNALGASATPTIGESTAATIRSTPSEIARSKMVAIYADDRV